MLIDTFAAKNPYFSNLSRFVETLRIVFLIISKICAFIPSVFATNFVQLITETVVFNFILDFDNKLHK